MTDGTHTSLPYPKLTEYRPALDLILTRLRAARAVQIIGHVRPDGDCIGSMLVMHALLEGWGIKNAMAAEQMPTNGYAVLHDFDQIQARPDAALNPDLVLFVDCATLDRGMSQWQPPAPIINIDHHASNTRYGEINWIDGDCAATGEMIFHLIQHAEAPLTARIAESLLVALTTDTGSFRFSNTGAVQHRIAAQLIEAGASAERVARIAYSSNPPECVQLTGHVLCNIRLECGGRLAWSEIRQATFRQFGGEGNAPENLADALRSIRGVKLSILFHELQDGAIRVNLRSDGDLNVGKLATVWGGGGHPCAAGVYLTKHDYEFNRDQILAHVMRVMEEGEGDLASTPQEAAACKIERA